jgi:hypothetical protein
MKLITCTHCGARKIGPSSGQQLHGAPVVMGRWTGKSHPMVVKCHRCTNSMKLTSLDFNRLPELTSGELEELGFNAQLAVQ